MEKRNAQPLVLAFDTANETIAVAIGTLDAAARTIVPIATVEEKAMRASNTRLLPIVDALFAEYGLARDDLACVGVGTGPGSFTGVRIAMSTAKGIAAALGIPLVGVSTLGAVAQGAWSSGTRGTLLVVGDAMRKELYPAYFELDDDGVRRLTPDKVEKAAPFVLGIPEAAEAPGTPEAACVPEDLEGEASEAADAAIAHGQLAVTGDALKKYAEALAKNASEANVAIEILPESLWEPTGQGILLELQRLWREGANILDPHTFDPMAALPVYTRLSDAEENERIRLADDSPRNLQTGVQGGTVRYMPFDVRYAEAAAALEAAAMGTDAWKASMIADDLGADGRTWWMALVDDELVGYAGALLAGDDLELLKIAVSPAQRRHGIATALLRRLAEDGRNLAASTMSLEVRASNETAIPFYEDLGFEVQGTRPHYYSDGEDALILASDIARLATPGLDGLKVTGDEPPTGVADEPPTGAADELPTAAEPHPRTAVSAQAPLILAIETSCDETAASVVDGTLRILSDVVASQVDFHARFGGVVPEIASRKHVEAIAGVAKLALADAEGGALSWHDLDAIAVTYAPGLVGALVVGVAFAKGASWALDIPLVAVNHLEGHLYANKLDERFAPPAVVSLVSGGNTMLVFMRDWQDYEILGGTIDDAVGEAFDKVAKTLGLPYPGGPHISRFAAEGDPEAIDFPRALMHSGDYRFSLSGLKTAVMVYVQKMLDAGEEPNLPDICASFQQAVVDVQVEKARRALRETGAQCLCIGGGVAANPALREAYERMCAEEGVVLSMPPLSACGDNAAMIGLVAQDRFAQGRFMDLSGDAYAHADLSEPY